MAIIRLANTDRVTLVDDDMYEKLNKYSWNIRIKKGRNIAYVSRPFYLDKKQTSIAIHRFILDLKTGDKRQVDHINGNGLDNRLINLRICNNQQNSFNTGIRKNNTSGFKGVYLKKSTGKWVTQLMKNGKSIHLGYHHDKIEAAKAYNKAAIKYHGEFARLNIF